MHENKSEVKISAVIGTFNRANLLKNALDSFRNQTLNKNEFEVILVDDGSTDNTKEVAGQYKNILPLKYFYQKKSGLSTARNHGIFTSSSKIVIFLDDDDVLAPDFLEKHLETHKKYPQENYAVLNHTTWSPDLNITPLMRFIVKEGGFLFSYSRLKNGEILDYTNFWGGRISCKRDFLITNGVFNPILKIFCEDIELGYRLSKYGLKIVYNSEAKNFMKRPMSLYDFIKRLYKQGRSQYIFSQLHNDPEIHKWAETINAEEIWQNIAPFYDAKLKSVKNLDEMINLRLEMKLEVSDNLINLLHSSYFWIFRATKLKGINDQKNSRKVADLNQSVQNKFQRIPNLSQVFQNKNKIIAGPNQAIQNKEQEIYNLNQLIRQKDQELTFVKSSKFWKIREKYIGLKDKLGIKLKLNDIFQKPIIFFNKKILYRDKLVRVRNDKWPEGKPLISVVIPCFNYGQYVEEAINSALNQTFNNLEIIVVEGGSTDDTTRKTLENIKKPKTKIFFREENHLVGDNRNYGIERAQGKYICCLDADDILEPTYIEKSLFLLETQKFDVVYPSVQFFENSDLIWQAIPTSFEENLIYNHLPSSAVFLKEIWEKGGSYKDWPVGEDHIPEDWEFWTRLLGMGFRFKNINEPLIKYRIHNAGLTAKCTSSIEKQRDAIKAENRIYFEKKYKKIRKDNERIIYKVYDGKINL